jgi:hypothetical protein
MKQILTKMELFQLTKSRTYSKISDMMTHTKAPSVKYFVSSYQDLSQSQQKKETPRSLWSKGPSLCCFWKCILKAIGTKWTSKLNCWRETPKKGTKKEKVRRVSSYQFRRICQVLLNPRKTNRKNPLQCFTRACS